MTNDYSNTWYALFSRNIFPTRTDREADFIARQLPVARFGHLLDLCCGEGRHTDALVRRGYRVTAIDRNADALRSARAACPMAQFIEMDAENIADLGQICDGAICMWQSFGYFDSGANARLLVDLGRVVHPGGRIVLDIYNGDFFRSRQGTICSERDGRRITERKIVMDGRLRVDLTYDDSEMGDSFDWQV